MRTAARLLAGAAAAALLGGCGGSAHHTARRTTHAGPTPTAPQEQTTTIPTPAPTGAPANTAAVHVIRAWSNALRHGDVRGAARYFALPSEMINGAAGGQVSVIRIRSAADAVAANESLPCGARFLSADMRGRYVNALFELTGRPGPGGSSCGSGGGVTARTNFVIAGGRIVEWIRAPDEPGDNGGQGAPPPSGPIA